MQLRKKPEKIQGFSWTRDLAIPMRCSNQLSYEATDVGSWSIMCSYVPVKKMNEVDVYEWIIWDWLPRYEVTSDIHTRVIHWTMGLTELISTHFTPDGWQGFAVVDARMLRSGWRGIGWVSRIYHFLSGSLALLSPVVIPWRSTLFLQDFSALAVAGNLASMICCFPLIMHLSNSPSLTSSVVGKISDTP